MPSLKLKKATMLTSFLLLSPIVLTSLYFIPRINNYHYVFFIFVMMSCWIIGGVNLFLSTKIESKFLKRIIIFLNLICILGWLFFGGWKKWYKLKRRKIILFNVSGISFNKDGAINPQLFVCYLYSFLTLIFFMWIVFNYDQSTEQKQMLERRFQFSFFKSD